MFYTTFELDNIFIFRGIWKNIQEYSITSELTHYANACKKYKKIHLNLIQIENNHSSFIKIFLYNIFYIYINKVVTNINLNLNHWIKSLYYKIDLYKKITFFSF